MSFRIVVPTTLFTIYLLYLIFFSILPKILANPSNQQCVYPDTRHYEIKGREKRGKGCGRNAFQDFLHCVSHKTHIHYSKYKIIFISKPLKYVTITILSIKHIEITNIEKSNSHLTGKSLSEALIFASTNPQYDERLFIELQDQYMKIASLEDVVYINCSECQNKKQIVYTTCSELKIFKN